jgi:uncharacterized RDD family membrane protein YckC
LDGFIARLIDFIIVSIGLGILFAVLSFLYWFDNTYMNVIYKSVGPFNYIISSLVFMAYWTDFESTIGESIGKKLLHLKTTDLDGKMIDGKAAVIESFGKACLLPQDVILGWIFTNNKRQRISNRQAIQS